MLKIDKKRESRIEGKGKDAKEIVTVSYVLTGHPDGQVRTFSAVDEAIDALNKLQDELAAESATPELRAGLTYRNELKMIRPNGFALITGTREDYQWLERNFTAIMATFKANEAKVAANYAEKTKALPKGEKRPESSPIAVVRPE